jgi:hypothetical protein
MTILPGTPMVGGGAVVGPKGTLKAWTTNTSDFGLERYMFLLEQLLTTETLSAKLEPIIASAAFKTMQKETII